MCGTLMRAQAPHVLRRPALPRSEALPSPPAADLLPDTLPCPSYAFPTPLAFSCPPQRRRSARRKKTRDAARRRVRHRDGALPCGGPGLATGLGWDGWEDEDAPSPFACCLTAVKLVQRAPAPRRAMRRCSLGRVGADAGAGELTFSTLSAASGVSRVPASPRALCKAANVRGGASAPTPVAFARTAMTPGRRALVTAQEGARVRAGSSAFLHAAITRPCARRSAFAASRALGPAPSASSLRARSPAPSAPSPSICVPRSVLPSANSSGSSLTACERLDWGRRRVSRYPGAATWARARSR
jgi:hypothetical protein